MPTDIPQVFSEEHDFTPLEAHYRREDAMTKARLFIGIGLAALAAGAGVGAAAYGLSFALAPKIIETTKVVTETRVERVEVPKIVEVPRIERVEVPRIVEKVVSAPQPPTAPPAGTRLLPEEFESSPAYKTAEFRGKIVSIIDGQIKFDNGRVLVFADPAGRPVGAPTTREFDGELAFCRRAGRNTNGTERWPCSVLHNGIVQNLAFPQRAESTNSNLFSDIFE